MVTRIVRLERCKRLMIEIRDTYSLFAEKDRTLIRLNLGNADPKNLEKMDTAIRALNKAIENADVK